MKNIENSTYQSICSQNQVFQTRHQANLIHRTTANIKQSRHDKKKNDQKRDSDSSNESYYKIEIRN